MHRSGSCAVERRTRIPRVTNMTSLRMIRIRLKRRQEREDPVVRRKSLYHGTGRRKFLQGTLFGRQVGFNVEVGGLNAFMPKP
jgi:hypothetical protein